MPLRFDFLVCSTNRSAAVSSLEEAERKIIASMESASMAFRSLAAADSSRAVAFDGHAESFLTDLAEAQELIRARIAKLGPDLPFENGSMRRLVEADIALHKTSHAHAALSKALEVADSGGDNTDPKPSETAVDVEGVADAADGAGAQGEVDFTSAMDMS